MLCCGHLASVDSRARPGLPPRVRLPLAAAVAMLSVVSTPLSAQPARNQPGAQGIVEETVTTQDGWRLPITYYPAKQADAPVAILLHMQGDNRLVWGDRRNKFAGFLNVNGFAVVTVDLRKHGEAKGDSAGSSDLTNRDYAAMLLDLEAVKQFIFDEHQNKKLNMAKIAVVAAGMSAPVAIQWTAYDWAKRPYNDAPTLAAGTPRGQDVKCLVLLSPQDDVPGISVPRALRALREPAIQCAVLIVYGQRVSADERAAKDIHRQLGSRRGAEKQIAIEPLDTPNRGTDLIGQGLQIETRIKDFLVDHTQKLDIAWRDRRSRLQRD
ncbi:MAG TPA: hypothetical protein VML55_20250 [Planctomycetaceae bacterium]|nr:hypothetical protein [Planctomycetaceae bacterium]